MLSRVDFKFESIFGIYKLPLLIDCDSKEEMQIVVTNIRKEIEQNYDNVTVQQSEINEHNFIEAYNELRNEIKQSRKTNLETYNWYIYSEDDTKTVEQRISDLSREIINGNFYPPITIGSYLGKKSVPVIVLLKKKYHENYDEPLAITLANMNERSFVVISRIKEHLVEWIQTQRIPGSVFKVRIDKANTNTNVQKHAHIFDLKDNELYSVNFDGSAHDGYDGYEISKTVADYLQKKGFKLNKSRMIEYLNNSQLQDYYYTVIEIKDSMIIDKIIDA